ncbi:hypothetical protein QOZ80_3AG0237220 [Eleusine coracana subsp. coracana]|nr:hypothetical protein QOZ80_3AG0237220 [Eleusine coracana subsp. coracana]
MATVDATTETGKAAAPPAGNFSGADLSLRALLFAATLSGLVVLVTAKQTEIIPIALLPQLTFGPNDAKFQDSPALIYLLVALCVTCLYSLLTAVSSLRFVAGSVSTTKKLFLLLVLDVLYAAIMASATGSAGGVAWIGLKGNSHTRWNKICNIYGKFCRHIGASAVVSLIASIILVLLAILNAYSLYHRSR